MFSVRDLTHHYGGAAVLRVDVWQAEQGAHWLLLGPSGSGKSTLIHVLGAILKPRAGSVMVAGCDLARLGAAELDCFRGQHVGIVLQRLHLVDSLTVADNLLLAQYLAGLPKDAARVKDVLASLDLAEKAGARPHELSHGQAQRVAVARGVINRPRLLLADEPTSNLDDERCMQALDLLEAQARECGATLVIATHDQRIKSRVPNRYVLGRAVA